MRLRPRSIRARLLVGILVALMLILGSAAWWSYSVTKHESEELFSARLATSARVLDAFVARQVERATIARPLVIDLPGELEHAADDAGTPLGHPYETKIAFQVWHDDGRLLVRSTSAPERPFSPDERGFSRQLVDGAWYNVFVLRSGGTRIQVAENDEVREELLHDLGVAVMMPLITGAALLLMLVNVLVAYGLAPLRQLAASIERRDPASLGQLEVRSVPEEALPVVRALDDLLGRVREALERERRFTDAAAHELRTPLAALKIHADNMARAATDADRLQSMRRLRQGLDRASRLAEQMLAYSRTQSASEREPRVPLLLAELVRESITCLEPLRGAKSQGIVVDVLGDAEACRIVGEPTKVQRLITNLLDNASRYAPERSSIRVALCRDGDHVALTVENAGVPIPPEMRTRVFEPYFRMTGSGTEGSGLGLAIVKEIADQHGAGIALDTRADGRGTAVRVRFPLADAGT